MRLEQLWHPLHSPLPNASSFTCTVLGPGALAYDRGLGQTPQNRVPLMVATRAGWEEATGWWGWP